MAFRVVEEKCLVDVPATLASRQEWQRVGTLEDAIFYGGITQQAEVN